MAKQISHNIDVARIVQISEKISWELEDIINDETSFDFESTFLPEAFLPLAGFKCLNSREKIILNQIFSHAYLNIFELAEEFIIGLTLRLSQKAVSTDRSGQRALSRFSDEELKHQQLFASAKEMIEEAYATPLKVLGDFESTSNFILQKSDLACLFLAIHLEIITQSHYVDGVRDRDGIDPLFAEILRNHWVEESQHVKIDIIEANKLALLMNEQDLDKAFNEYHELVLALCNLVNQQAHMCVDSLQMALARVFDRYNREDLVNHLNSCLINGLIFCGLQDEKFQAIVSELIDGGEARLNQVAASVEDFVLSCQPV